MNSTLELPSELEQELANEASQLKLPLFRVYSTCPLLSPFPPKSP